MRSALCLNSVFGGIHKSGYVELQSRPSYSQAEGFCRRMTSPQSASRPSGTINTNYAPCQRAPVGRNLFSPGLPRMCAQNHQQKPFRGFSLLQARSHRVRCSPRFLVRAPGAGGADLAGGASGYHPLAMAPCLSRTGKIATSGPQIAFIYLGSEFLPLSKEEMLM